MTNRQVGLITQLVYACWAHNEKLGASILLELLGPQINEEIAVKVKEIIRREANGRAAS